MIPLPDLAQSLLWAGGQIDVRVEVDTGTTGSGDEFALWGEDLWAEFLWGSSAPGWLDLSIFVLTLDFDGGAERWGQRFKTGSATIILDNTTGIFTQDADVVKPFHLPFRPGRKIRVVAIPDPSADPESVGYRVPLFTGVIDSTSDDYAYGAWDNTTRVLCFDNGAVWSGFNPPMLSTPTGVELSSDRITSALDRLNWPVDDRDIQTGEHSLQSSDLAQSTWEECQTAADAEGGAFFAGKDGKAVFKSRDWLSVEDPDDSGVVVLSFASPAGSPYDLAWDGSSLWHTDDVTNTVYELDPSDGSVISSFAAPGSNSAGLAWDGTNLWLSDYTTQLIYKLSTSGSVLDSFAAPGSSASGLAWDGSSLWLADFGGEVYEIDPDTGSTLSSFTGPGTQQTGLTFDGTSLYLTDMVLDTIYKFTTEGVLLDSFPSQGDQPRGLGWDGHYLWHSDKLADLIYRLAPPRRGPTEIQGYLGYDEVPDGVQGAHVIDVDTSWELARIRNQVRFARVGSTMQEAEDATSQTLYGVRSYERTDFKNNADADLVFLAARHVKVHKDNRMRVDAVTIAGVVDGDNEDLNRLLWATEYGDLLSVRVMTGQGWSFERLVQVFGIHHHITGDDWEVTFRLDDAQINFLAGRDVLMAQSAPVAWWKFSESGGTSTADQVGTHTLTWNGTPTLASSGGPIAGGDGIATLDGTDDYATVANEADLELHQNMTFEARVRPHDATGALQAILSVRGTGDDRNLYSLYWYPDNSVFRFYPLGSAGVSTDIAAGAANVWHHLVVTVEWTATERRITRYVDGVQGFTSITSYLPSVIAREANVGREGTDGGEFFNGDISELAVWDRLLAPSEITNLYNASYE